MNGETPRRSELAARVLAWLLLRPPSAPRRALDRLARAARRLARRALRPFAGGPRGEPVIYYWVDSTVTFPTNTGIQRVTRQLARALIEGGWRLVPVKWGGQGEPLIPPSKDELAYFALWNGPSAGDWAPWIAPDEAQGGWFMMTELPLNLTDAEQKLVRGMAVAAGLKSAAVFYDTIPWKMRDIYPEGFAAAHRAYIGELANYDRVLAISDYSRREMIAFLGEEFQRPESELDHVRACLLPAEFPERQPSEPAPRAADGAVEILTVGTVEPRKNHERLITAFELAADASPVPLRLTIAGGALGFDPSLAERVKVRVDADPRIIWEQGADDARIKALYERCDFTVYPSVEEGFGLPILESLWQGKPCVCADFGAMREAAGEGGGCLMADVRDIHALAKAIRRLAEDAGLRLRLADEARCRVFRTWADYVTSVAAELGLRSCPTPEAVAEHRAQMGLTVRPRL